MLVYYIDMIQHWGKVPLTFAYLCIGDLIDHKPLWTINMKLATFAGRNKSLRPQTRVSPFPRVTPFVYEPCVGYLTSCSINSIEGLWDGAFLSLTTWKSYHMEMTRIFSTVITPLTVLTEVCFLLFSLGRRKTFVYAYLPDIQSFQVARICLRLKFCPIRSTVAKWKCWTNCCACFDSNTAKCFYFHAQHRFAFNVVMKKCVTNAEFAVIPVRCVGLHVHGQDFLRLYASRFNFCALETKEEKMCQAQVLCYLEKLNDESNNRRNLIVCLSLVSEESWSCWRKKLSKQSREQTNATIVWRRTGHSNERP